MQLAGKIKIVIAVAAFLIPALGWSADAPHTNIGGYDIQCGNCHWTNSAIQPPWTSIGYSPAPADDSINNRRCWVCHDGNKVLVPAAVTHSTSTTENKYWISQGGWTTQCVTCHDPHQQRQTRVWSAPTHVVTGAAPVTVGAYDSGTHTTQITLSGTLASNYFGYYLLPDKTYPVFYRIESNTTNTNVLQVKGQVIASYVKSGGYAIVYGKDVKDAISYTNPGGTTVGGSVKLYRQSGTNGLGDKANAATSVCYVCHSQTTHWTEITDKDHNDLTNCTSCHQHIKGFKPSCDSCHGSPPTVSSQAPQNGLVWVTIAGGATTGTGSTTAGAHNTHVNTKGIACDACHYNTVGTGATHNAGSVTLGFKGFGGSTPGGSYNGQAGVNYNATTTTPATSASSGGLKQCSNVYCHGSTMASNGGNNTSPTWDVASTGACGTCHGADSANPPQLGSHVEHTSASTGYSFTCTLCHKTAVGQHINGSVDWAFDTGDNRTNGGRYNSAASGSTNAPAPSGTYQSCSSLYCHSIVQTSTGGALTGAAGEYKNPTWGSIWDRARTNASTLCSSCHEYRALGSGNHLKHVGTTIGNYRYHCGKCHYDNTCTNCHSLDMNTMVMSPSVHVNGQVNVQLWTTVIGGTYSGTSAPGDGSFGNCTNLYCHSKGTVETGAFEAPNTMPTWGGTLPADCTGCHGGDRNASTQMSTGSHSTHVVGSGMDCVKCHTTTVTNSRTLYDRNQHVNPDIKKVNIEFDAASNPGGNATYNGVTSPIVKTPGTAYGSCANLYCHGTVSPVWGGTLANSCDSCHSGQGAGTAVTKSYAIAHSTKHTQSYLLACENCHTQLHSGAANRISHAGGDVNPSTPQTVEVKFTDQTGSTQYGGGGDTFRYSNLFANPYGATAPTPVYTPAGTSAGSDPKNASITWTAGSCSTVWCHSNANPAGGTNSYSNPAWNSVINCGSCHREADTAANMAAAGTPAPMSVSHVEHIATDQYGQNSNFTCNTCHSNTASDSSTISNTANHVNGGKNVTLNTWVGGSFATNQCSNTYCHSQGTSTATPPAPNVVAWWGGSLDPNSTTTNCEGCHGAKYGGGYTSTMNTNVHDAHINPASVDKRGSDYGCSECHNATMSGSGMSIGNYANHVNKLVNIKFRGDAPHVNRDTDTPAFNGSPTTGANGATKPVGDPAGSCSNVYCHSVGNLDNTGAVVAVGSPAVGFRTMTWSTATSIGCDGCHGDQGGKAHPVYASGLAGSDTANSHVKHVEGSAITCDTCHTGTTASTTIPPTSVVAGGTHLDRQETVAFKNIGGSSGVYNAGKTCSATYCHGTGPSPAWGGSTNCATCHDASQALAGAHNKHYATATTAGANTTGRTSDAANYIFNCGTCHDPSVTYHAQGPANTTSGRAAEISLNVTWATGYTGGTYTEGGTIATDSRGFKYSSNNTCTNVYCHSDGKPLGATDPTYRTVVWDQAPASPNCGICHDATPATNVHTRHSSTYGFGCVKCHSATVSDNSTISNKDNHANFEKDVAWDATNSDGDVYSSPDCANIYCHSKGQANAAPYNNAGNTPNIAAAWNGTMNSECTGCHNGNAAATGGLTMATNSHTAHVNNTAVIGDNFACNICHSATASGDRTIGTVNNHVNKQINVAFTALNPSAAYSGDTVPGGAAGNCSNTYCHSTGNLSALTASLPSPQYGAAGSQSHYTQMQWGGSGIVCNGCHGKSTTTGAPDYANAGAGSPGANSHPKHTVAGASTCVNCHSSTTTTGTSIITGSLHLNGERNVIQGNEKTFSYIQASQTCSSISCHFSGTAQWGATLQCSDCHSSLSGTHGKHTLVAGASYGSTGVSTTGGVYNFGCGNCHPVDASYHADGAVEITLNSAQGGTLKSKNNVANDTGGYTRNEGVSVTCSAAYCHSKGNGTFITSVDWFAATMPADKCGHCHGNSPDTGSHPNHVMAGIHYDDIFTGTTGLKPSTTRADIAVQLAAVRPHGNAATATTINCNVCHNGTVTVSYNRQNSHCVSCHDLAQPINTATGDADIVIDAASGLHLNGVVDVQLKAGAVLSKAQLRNDASTATGAPAGWTRSSGYKASGSNDSATINAGDWASGTRTCLTACHLNQSSPVWGTPTTCSSCHATLPQ